MGKAGKDRKRQRILSELQSLPHTASLNEDDISDNDESNCLPTEQQLNETISVLDALAQNLDIFRSVDLKAFRISLQPLVSEQKDKHFERRKLEKVDSDSLRQLTEKSSILAASRVLTALGENLEAFRTKQFKQLRTSLHPLIIELAPQKKGLTQAINGTKAVSKPVSTELSENNVNHSKPTHHVSGNFSGRVSAHFIAQEWEEALAVLEQMRVAQQNPKLGALQRWIRDADLAPPALRFPLIDAVLRVVVELSDSGVGNSGSDRNSDRNSSNSVVSVDGNNEVVTIVRQSEPVHLPLFIYTPPVPNNTIAIESSETADDMNICPVTTDNIRIVQTVHADDRPSNTDLNMYTLVPSGVFVLKNNNTINEKSTNSNKSSSTLSDSNSVNQNTSDSTTTSDTMTTHTTTDTTATTTISTITTTKIGTNTTSNSNSYTTLPRTHIKVPGVPGCFLMSNVLTHSECDSWLHIANTMKFSPDAVLGINHVLWLADTPLIDSLYERVKPYLPQSIDGCPLVGINARLRFFRYEPGATYRVHIDGAWPGSGFDSDGNPVDDIFNDRYSRLTFLVYLNDDFEGGHTTFFMPNKEKVGVLEARAVKPHKGSILCFPHGDAVGSLAHEGTSVISGTKYVIRTDVLYMLPEKKNKTTESVAVVKGSNTITINSSSSNSIGQKRKSIGGDNNSNNKRKL